jgi:hypothetical protein
MSGFLLLSEFLASLNNSLACGAGGGFVAGHVLFFQTRFVRGGGTAAGGFRVSRGGG